MESEDSSDEGPSSPKKIKYVVNGESRSRATSYQAKKKERDAVNNECKANFEKVCIY